MKTHPKMVALLATGFALVGCGGTGTNHPRPIQFEILNFTSGPAELAFIKLPAATTVGQLDDPGVMYFDSPYPKDPLTGDSPKVTIMLADYDRLAVLYLRTGRAEVITQDSQAFKWSDDKGIAGWLVYLSDDPPPLVSIGPNSIGGIARRLQKK